VKETAGELLARTREEKRIPLKTASEETNITLRHLKALEENNFGVFPGETYAIGFLKSYAQYLELDSDKIIQMYRGIQLVEKEVPLRELTRPTLTIFDYVKKYSLPTLLPLIIIAVGYLIYTQVSFEPGAAKQTQQVNKQPDIEDIIQTSNQVPVEETEHVKLRSGFTTALVPIGKGIDFSIDNVEVYLILKTLEYNQENSNENKAFIEFYPGKKEFLISPNDPVWVSEEAIPRKFRISLMGATPNTVKLQIDLGEKIQAQEEQGEETSESSENISVIKDENFIIRLEAFTTGQNFIEICVDGKPCKRELFASNSKLFYEASDSIQMKIGDAGAIKIRVNSKEYKFGKKGEQVSKIIRKVRDPIEQTKFQVIVKDL